MNVFGDLEDLEQVFSRGRPVKGQVFGSGSCSALIKVCQACPHLQNITYTCFSCSFCLGMRICSPPTTLGTPISPCCAS